LRVRQALPHTGGDRFRWGLKEDQPGADLVP
jgi:hypothetical protein